MSRIIADAPAVRATAGAVSVRPSRNQGRLLPGVREAAVDAAALSPRGPRSLSPEAVRARALSASPHGGTVPPAGEVLDRGSSSCRAARGGARARAFVLLLVGLGLAAAGSARSATLPDPEGTAEPIPRVSEPSAVLSAPAQHREHTDLRMTTAHPSLSSGFAVAFDPEAFRSRMASYAAASASGPGEGTARPLRLEEVLESVEEHFPVLLAAREEIAIAEAELVAARGGFDTRLRAGAAAEPYGFYQHELFDVGVTQPTTLGGLELDGGYRLGQGDFAIWDKGLQTNDDGEVYLGLKLPLLRGRAIDGRRLQLWKARLERERVEPEIAALVLETRRDAALRYWQWVAAGEKLTVAEHLLDLAENRQDAMRAAVEEGLIARIELADNERLIAERRAIRVQAERALEKAAIALSFYLRGDDGEPLQPAAARLHGFPAELEQPSVSPDEALEVALASRPEIRDLELYRRQLELEQRKAGNDLLPQLDLRVKASQDYGAPSGLVDDKGPFELFAGVAFSLPAQRREAKGALRRRDAELRQMEQKQRLQRDRISVEVRDALSAWTQASRRIEEARRSVALAEELESAERFQVQEGNSDLLRLNIRERQTAQASAFLVDVLQEYFEAWTRYQAVTGRAAEPGALLPAARGV